MSNSTLLVAPHNTRVPFSRAWERECQIVPNRGQTYFPEAPEGTVYDVTVTGRISYRFKVASGEGWLGKAPYIHVTGSADALYMTTLHPKFYSSDRYKDTRCFDQPHDWLRINDRRIGYFPLIDKNGRKDRWGLEADRKAHIYRLSINDAGAPLVMACEVDLNKWGDGDANFTSSSGFTVSVTAWAEHKVEQKRDPVIIAPAPLALPASAVLPSKPILTADQVRERKVWHQQRDLLDKVELVKARVALEMNLEAYVAEKYAHLDDDRRQGILQRMLDQIEGDEHDGKTL